MAVDAAWRQLPDTGDGPGLRVVLPYPPSTNRYWRSAPGKGMVPSHEAMKYRRDVAHLLAGCMPLLGDVIVSHCHVYRPRKSGDLSNRIKVLEDALQGLAYVDDAQIYAYRDLVRLDDPKRPRVEIELYGERRATRGELERLTKERLERMMKRRAAHGNRRRG